MSRGTAPVAALAVAAALLAPSVFDRAAAQDDFEGLAPGPGQEDVYYACSACHSTLIVQQQGLSRERWEKMLDWMVEEQGMAELPPDQHELVLDYLSKEYGPDRPNWPRG